MPKGTSTSCVLQLPTTFLLNVCWKGGKIFYNEKGNWLTFITVLFRFWAPVRNSTMTRLWCAKNCVAEAFLCGAIGPKYHYFFFYTSALPLLNCGLIFGAGQAVAIRILFGQMGHDLTPTNPKHHQHHHVGPWRQGDPLQQPYHKMLLKEASSSNYGDKDWNCEWAPFSQNEISCAYYLQRTNGGET